MPSGTAVKPGDVVTALNGKTIQIDNTDAEGRLILADALAYGQRKYQPSLIINIATLTGKLFYVYWLLAQTFARPQSMVLFTGLVSLDSGES